MLNLSKSDSRDFLMEFSLLLDFSSEFARPLMSSKQKGFFIRRGKSFLLLREVFRGETLKAKLNKANARMRRVDACERDSRLLKA